MTRILVALSVLSFLGVSYSARGEHSGGGSGGRTVIQIPAVSSGERLNELIGACSNQRPFPPLRFKQVDITPPTPPVDDVIRSVPPQLQASNPPPGDAVPLPPTDAGTPPIAGGGDTGRGQAIYNNRCAKCHESGMAPPIKGKADQVATRTANGSMPSDGSGALSAAEQAELVAFMRTSN